MPNAALKKADGTSGGDVALSDSLFAAKINMGLMHQAVLAERTNTRQDTRNTKTRAQVAGGGRKPYRQKGTGRARQGSISAPHYRHGGIVFGPHPRNLSAHLPKKARRAALLSALTAKANDNAVVVLESIGLEAISTKAAATLLTRLGVSGKTMIVLPEHTPILYKSFRNIPGIQVRVAPAFSVQDVLDAEQIVFVQAALDKLNAMYGKAEATGEEAAQ